MRIEFDLNNVQNNSTAACKREQTRMLLLCWAMRKIGNEAWCSNPSKEMRQSSRWPMIAHLVSPSRPCDALVVSERHRRRERGVLTVIFKTSVSIRDDASLLRRCDILMAHENDPAFNEHPKLLAVPFMCSNVMIGQFFDDGVIQRYVFNDLKTIRTTYCAPKTRRLGHVGSGMYGRKAWAAQLPSWAEFRWVEGEYDHPNRLTPTEYLQWLSSCEAGVFMAGATPKSYRWSELALLGVPIVCVSQPVPITPPATPHNTILLKDWSDHDTLTEGMGRLDEVRRAADESYKTGWSPLGQASILADRLTCLASGRSNTTGAAAQALCP